MNDNRRLLKSHALDLLLERLKTGTFKEILDDWKWILSYSSPMKGSIILYTLLGILSASLGLASSIAGKFLIDVVIGRQVDKLWLAALVMAASSLGSLALVNASGRLRQKMELATANAIRRDVFDAVMNAHWQSLRHYSSGDMLNRFHGDISAVASNAVSWIPTVILSVYTFIASFAVIWHYSPVMCLIALAGAPVFLLMSRYMIVRQREYRGEMAERTSDLFTFETEALYNVDTVKSFGIMDAFSYRLRELQDQYRRLSLAWNMFHIRTNVSLAVLGLVIEYISYGYCLFLLWGSRITFGTMTLFLEQRSALTGAFESLVRIIPSFINSSVSAHRIRELTELPRERREENIPEEFRRGGLTVRLDGVGFSYEDGEQVISDSCFEAKPGQITALVGPSGEGKTTVLRLLLGIVPPDEGRCVFCTPDGQELAVSAGSRSLISYVPQGNTLLSGTIAENMRLVRPEASDEEIIAALKLACAWDFVERLPETINSDIYERGKGFSEGQAQRISIARALLRDAPILMMDEATSALDVETERQLLKNILKKAPDKTCVITTHRPTVLSMCDRVYRVVDTKITPLASEEIDTIVRNF